MAYELLLGEGYDFSVDWWSIGCIFFELLCGVPPFFAETAAQVFQNILNFETSLNSIRKEVEEAEITFSPNCWDFITKLLCKPEARLGYKAEDPALAIFKHPFFSDLDVNNIRSLKPPFVPRVRKCFCF